MKQKMSTLEFEAKYWKYKDTIFRIIITYVKNQDDAEDILQNVFYKLLYQSPDFANEEHEKRWLIRTSINHCKNHLSSFWNRKRTMIEDNCDMGQWGMTSEESSILEEVLALPEKYKITCYLYYFEGYTCAEIGQILKCTSSAVKMRLKKSRDLLKMELED